MGNKAVSKVARRAAREAAAAAQEEMIRRTKANVEDLAAFFDARDRAEAVDAWFAERQRALGEQAAQRRAGQRLACGAALRSMRDRGEPLREIARLAGIREKTVRELIREAEAPQAVAGEAAMPAGAGDAAPRWAPPVGLGPGEMSAHEARAVGGAPEPMSGPIWHGPDGVGVR
ncbi:hypothetical protein MML61_27550 (plasmid) [Mycobacterium marinum]|nr:hypothetical protein [Mycobacterium marinum]WCS21170.1 hypothetical protein MML61_27550 [Mycobacterium marinum]WOR07527.1 hypothetical protein QDR78_27430 [Mycobacterium marinum]CDM79595.1 hypothetical protein MMARE11_p00930 [Mycobacterium marinum E11]BBC69091.1 hypothetical protein MMRN_p0600 [Mycobacterium marinum]GJO51799.1 hypothetical protein NJB1604_40040 [Mycobacterium marinum]